MQLIFFLKNLNAQILSVECGMFYHFVSFYKTSFWLVTEFLEFKKCSFESGWKAVVNFLFFRIQK